MGSFLAKWTGTGMALVASLLLAGGAAAHDDDCKLSRIERLGKKLFFDDDLSTPPGQSCAACHGEKVGFTGPEEDINKRGAVYPGAIRSRFGNRKPPAAAYAGDSPVLHYDDDLGVFVGGMFWDGRATGETLGDPLAEQAEGPFLNPLEQNNPNPRSVVLKVRKSDYRDLFEKVWGRNALDDVDRAYEQIARSIAAYERSPEVSPFSSKYDRYLAGKATLSRKEAKGLALFEGKANCAACHPSQPGPDGEPPLFTDFTYDNIGVPKNPRNPFYREPQYNPDGKNWVDLGLGAFLATQPGYGGYAEQNYGKHKVPTLRNVDERPDDDFDKAYAHNGYFKSLEEIVHFYNTRDVLPPPDRVSDPKPGLNCWPPPEVTSNLNRTEVGNLGLTDDEEDAIVSFLETLTDRKVDCD